MADDPDDPDDLGDGLARRRRRHDEAAALAGPSAPATDDDLEGVTEEDIAAARAARRRRSNRSTIRNLLEWAAVIVGAVLIALVVRTFVFQTFWIPSASMADTLAVDDRVLVNKLSYRFGDVKRGDVVVFKRPPNETGSIDDLIKRVVALPGERVSIRDGSVFVDDQRLDEPYTDGLPTEPRVGCGAGDTSGIDTRAGLEIPEGHVLVLGDNRVDSSDGRCFGPIDEDLIVGRAFVVIWPPSKVGGL